MLISMYFGFQLDESVLYKGTAMEVALVLSYLDPSMLDN